MYELCKVTQMELAEEIKEEITEVKPKTKEY